MCYYKLHQMISKKEKLIRIIQSDDIARFKNYHNTLRKNSSYKDFLKEVNQHAITYNSSKIINFVSKNNPSTSDNICFNPRLHISDLYISRPESTTDSFELFDPLIPHCDFHTLYKLKLTSRSMYHYVCKSTLLTHCDRDALMLEAVFHHCQKCIGFLNYNIVHADPEFLIKICELGLRGIKYLPQMIKVRYLHALDCVRISKRHKLSVSYQIMKYLLCTYPVIDMTLEYYHLSDVDISIETPIPIHVCPEWTIIFPYLDHHSLCKLRLTCKSIRYQILNKVCHFKTDQNDLIKSAVENNCAKCITYFKDKMSYMQSDILHLACQKGVSCIKYFPRIFKIDEPTITKCLTYITNHKPKIQYVILKYLFTNYSNPIYFDSLHLEDLQIDLPEPDFSIEYQTWEILLMSGYFDFHLICKMRLTNKTVRHYVMNTIRLHKFELKMNEDNLIRNIISNNCILCTQKFKKQISDTKLNILETACKTGLSCIRYFPKLQYNHELNVARCADYGKNHKPYVTYDILKYLFDNYKYPNHFDMYHLADLKIDLPYHSEFFENYIIWELIAPYLDFHTKCIVRLTSKTTRHIVLKQKLNFIINHHQLFLESVSNNCVRCINKMSQWHTMTAFNLYDVCKQGLVGIQHFKQSNSISFTKEIITKCIEVSQSHSPQVMYQLSKYVFGYKIPNYFSCFHLEDLSVGVSELISSNPVWDNFLFPYLGFHSLCKLRMVSKSIRYAQTRHKYNFDVPYNKLILDGIFNSCRSCIIKFQQHIQQMGSPILETVCKEGLIGIQYFPTIENVSNLNIIKCIEYGARHPPHIRFCIFRYFVWMYNLSDRTMTSIIQNSMVYDPWLLFDYAVVHKRLPDIDRLCDWAMIIINHMYKTNDNRFGDCIDRSKVFFSKNCRETTFPDIARYDKYIRRLGSMIVALYPEILWALCSPSLVHNQKYCDDMYYVVCQPSFKKISSKHILASLIAWKNDPKIMTAICTNYFGCGHLNDKF